MTPRKPAPPIIKTHTPQPIGLMPVPRGRLKNCIVLMNTSEFTVETHQNGREGMRDEGFVLGGGDSMELAMDLTNSMFGLKRGSGGLTRASGTGSRRKSAER